MDIGPLLTAVVWIGAGLLIHAGSIKIGVPDGAMASLHSLGLPSGRIAARVLGAAEISAGLLIVLLGGQIAAAVGAVAYLALTAVAARQRAKQVDCGCFGVATYPVSRLHIAVNALIGVVSAAAMAAPLQSLAAVASDVGAMGTLAAVVLTATAVGLVTTMIERAGRADATGLVPTRGREPSTLNLKA